MTLPDREVRMWTMLCHLAALLGLLIPIGTAVGPLVVWLIKRNDHPAIDLNGKEALNFQISWLIYTWALGLLGVLTVVFLVGFLFVGLAAIGYIIALIYAVIAAIKVNDGGSFRYPLTIRFFT